MLCSDLVDASHALGGFESNAELEARCVISSCVTFWHFRFSVGYFLNLPAILNKTLKLAPFRPATSLSCSADDFRHS